MNYVVEFNRDSVYVKLMGIWTKFRGTEEYFERGDLPRNIRNACAFCEEVRSLGVLGADVEAGIYNDKGFDRIGYARINTHEFVKNGAFNEKKLRAALDEMAGYGKAYEERMARIAEEARKIPPTLGGGEDDGAMKHFHT